MKPVTHQMVSDQCQYPCSIQCMLIYESSTYKHFQSKYIISDGVLYFIKHTIDYCMPFFLHVVVKKLVIAWLIKDFLKIGSRTVEFLHK